MPREKKAADIIEGVGLFLGMLIGAGMFALPYSFLKGGFSWSMILFAAVFIISLFLHFLYAGIIFATPGKHRFIGYVRTYLGQRAGKAAFVFTYLSYAGAMLAYGVLGGTFLNIIFGSSFFNGGILFLLIGGLLFLLSLDFVGEIDFYLSLALFCFVSFLSFKLFPSFNLANISASTSRDIFLPYGIFIFALGAYSALPDIWDVLGRSSKYIFKKIIFWGLFSGALFYLLFSFSILGAMGNSVSKDAFSNLGRVLGKEIVVIGAIIGLLAIFRTYLAFGADSKLTFRYDFGLSKSVSWLLAFSPPFILFIAGFTDLTRILSFVGSVGLGIFAIFIILMAWRIRDKVSAFMGFGVRAWWLMPLGLLIVLGALQDIFVLIFN